METQEQKPTQLPEMSRGEAKRVARQDAARRKNKAKWFWVCGGALAVIGIAGLIVWAGAKKAKNAPGASFPMQGQEHVALDYQFTYNSNPPTSGPHYASPANWGVYDYEVNDKFFIHNMEHGGIWISYKPTVSVEVVDNLKKIVDKFGGSKLVMAPRGANDSDIAVAAWTRVLKLDLVNGDITDDQMNQIRAFYKAFKNKGPEFVPDTMPGVDPKSAQ